MTTPVNATLTVQQGETFIKVVRWEVEPYIYKAITGTIQQSAPAVIPCSGHGVPNGWRVAFAGVQGMTQLNAVGDSNGLPRDPQDFHQATVRDTNTIELNKVNASAFTAHTTGTGYIQYWTPKDMTGFTGRMQIKDKKGGTLLLELNNANAGVFVDNPNKQVILTITPAMTASATWTSGVYDLELTDASGNVTKLMEGRVTLIPEVTT